MLSLVRTSHDIAKHLLTHSLPFASKAQARQPSCRKFLKTSLHTISRTINVGNNAKFYAHDTFKSSLLCKCVHCTVNALAAQLATHSVYEILIQRELFDQKSIER